MSIIEIVFLAIALSMDAFAVAICKGLATGKVKTRHMLITGAWFGGFQALMPLLGFLVGSLFADYVRAVDHWIAFVLLALIGANMIKESFSKDEECECECSCQKDSNPTSPFAAKTMLTMAIATSIDALAIGISFAMVEDMNISLAVALIGIITFALSFAGVKIGAVFGAKNRNIAELAGGIVLIIIGLKILLEHLGVLVL